MNLKAWLLSPNPSCKLLTLVCLRPQFLSDFVPSFGLAAIHRAEWVDIVSYSWLPKRQIRICMRAFNKLWIREERASFRPPALIKLIRATSLAPKFQNDKSTGGILKINDISAIWAQKIKDYNMKIAKKRPFFVGKLTLSMIFWKPVTKSSNPPIAYVRSDHSLRRIRLNF